MNKVLNNSKENGETTTEQQILAAAEREFVSKGFAGARTTSIAEAAGVTHAMLHYYFRTKENLFEKIIAEKADMLQEVFLGAFGDESATFSERIKMGVARHFDFVAANPQLPMFVFNEVSRDAQRCAGFVNRAIIKGHKLIMSLQRQIDDAAARGECRPMDAVHFLMDIASLNLFTFIAAPLLETAGVAGRREEFLRARKQENIETIMSRMKP